MTVKRIEEKHFLAYVNEEQDFTETIIRIPRINIETFPDNDDSILRIVMRTAK